MQRILSKSLRTQIHQTPFFLFSYSRFNSDSVSTKIYEMQSSEKALRFYSESKESLRPDQLALTLRVIGKHFTFKSLKQSKELLEDSEFKDLTAKITENLNYFTEQDCSDILFFLKKAYNLRFFTIFPEPFISELIEKVNEMAKSSSINFPTLVNIFIDLKGINRDAFSIAQEMISKLREESTFLSPFVLNSILFSFAEKGIRSFQEGQVFDLILKKVSLNFESYEIGTIINSFKNIAVVQAHLNSFPFITPKILFLMKSYIAERIDGLNDTFALSILDAYSHLPKEFPKDLLDEIKDMLILTMEFSKESLNCKTIIEFMFKYSKIKNQRKQFTEDQIEKLESYLEEYVEEQHSEISTKIMQEKVSFLSAKGFFSNSNFLSKYFTSLLERENFQIPLIDLIIQFHQKLDSIDPLVEATINNLKSNSKTWITSRDLQFLNFFLESVDHPKTAELKELSQEQLTQQLSLPPLRIHENLNYLSSRGITVEPYYSENYEALMNSLPQKRNPNFYSIILSTVPQADKTPALREAILKGINSKMDSIFLTKGLLAIKDLGFKEIGFFMQILLQIPYENLPLSKILGTLASSSEISVYFQSNHIPLFSLFNLVNNFVEKFENQEMNGKLNSMDFFKFINSLEKAGVKGVNFYKMIRKIYSQISKNTEYQNGVDRFYITKIQNEIGFTPETSLQIYNAVKDRYRHNHVARMLLIDSSYENSEMDYLIEEIIQTNHEQLSDKSQRKIAVELFCELVRMPPKFQKNPKILNEHSSEILGFVHLDSFLKIVKCIRKDNIRVDQPQFYNLLKEINSYLEMNIHRIPLGIALQILEIFSEFGSRSSKVINILLPDITKKFKGLRTWQVISVIDSLKKMGSINPEFFDLSIDYIQESFHKKINFSQSILKVLTEAGYQSPKVTELIEEIASNNRLLPKNLYTSYNFASSCIVANSPHEEFALKLFFEIYQKRQNSDLQVSFFKKNRWLFDSYVRQKYSNENWNSILDELSQENPSSGVIFGKKETDLYSITTQKLQKALSAMKIEFNSEGTEFYGIFYPISIPDQFYSKFSNP